jgi:hypothetical protein
MEGLKTGGERGTEVLVFDSQHRVKNHERQM